MCENRMISLEGYPENIINDVKINKIRRRQNIHTL